MFSDDFARSVVIYKEAGSFAAWPANHGIWSWGDEIVVGFKLGYYKENPSGGHAIDRERPDVDRQARSLDGGQTWTVEIPSHAKNGELMEPRDSPGGVDFYHPDLAVKFRFGYFYYSLDRCKKWNGPFRMPTFGRGKLLARTDYMVEGKHALTAFVAASKGNGEEG